MLLHIAEPASGTREYHAFEAHERATRLNIRCARGPSRCPAYPYLLDIIYDHQFAESFTLIFTFMAVEVRGKHLDAIVHAIEFGSCSRITEFHSKLFDAPAPGQPIIESVEITAAEYAAEIADRGKERAAR